MKIKAGTLNNRLMGFAMIPFPARKFLATGIRMRMNATGRSHNKANNGMGKFSWKYRRLINSRSTNGSTRSELMIAGDLRLVKILFIGFDHVEIGMSACATSP
jgi:hypothetical protein